MTVIHLGAPLPARSSHLPADVTRAASMSAYLVLLRMEVAAFHPLRIGLTRPGRLVSVALFLAFTHRASGDLWRPGVTRHPALWSPDFPLLLRLRVGAATVWLASRS